MNPRSSLRYLDSLIGSGIRPGLQRMRALLRAAGHPEKNVPAIVVAGTNGKGSTCATLASIFQCAGTRTGFYSSPHLVDIRERWRIDGAPISIDAFDDAVELLRRAADDAQVVPTYFEALTLLAFLAFDKAACEIAILEVGMGGRLDATNVVRPLASLVTSIGLDHMEFLGGTLEAIAREKAGVFHRGCSALTSETNPAVLEVLEARAAAVGVTLHRVASETVIRKREMNLDGIAFRLRTPRGSYSLKSPLTGAHQFQNIALAVRAAEELTSTFPSIDRASIERGIASTLWRGRLERFRVGDRTIIVDGAHNPAAAERLASFVESMVASPRTLVFAVMRDKAVDEIARLLFPLFDEIIVTSADPERGASPSLLRALAREVGKSAALRSRPAAAFAHSLELAPENIVISGSLYLAGAAVAFLDRRVRREKAAVQRRDESSTQIPSSGRSRDHLLPEW